MALIRHTTEDYSYFLLPTHPGTLFGTSCTRQCRSTDLINRPLDVTRSTIQKAVVVLSQIPCFGPMREKLGVITSAYFAQKDFEDVEIIKHFYESLEALFKNGMDSADLYMGMTVRALLYKFRWKTLVLLKALLLEHKILFFASRTEELCILQYSLISLLPLLLENLVDAAHPDYNSLEHSIKKANTLKTSDRASLFAYMGLPIQVFCKVRGVFFGPYCPLQQLDLLEASRAYIIGTTNSLFLERKDHQHADIVINIDTGSVDIYNPHLAHIVSLTVADRTWIDGLVDIVVATWDENDPTRPKDMGYLGSEDYIRTQFESYFLALLATAKYAYYTDTNNAPENLLPNIEGNPVREYGEIFLDSWRLTKNYVIWMAGTDDELFDIVEARHPACGSFGVIGEVSQRVSQKINELDERIAPAREAFWKTGTRMKGLLSGSATSSPVTSPTEHTPPGTSESRKKSWTAWAGEKRRKVIERWNSVGEIRSPTPSEFAREGSIKSTFTANSETTKVDLMSDEEKADSLAGLGIRVSNGTVAPPIIEEDEIADTTITEGPGEDQPSTPSEQSLFEELNTPRMDSSADHTPTVETVERPISSNRELIRSISGVDEIPFDVSSLAHLERTGLGVILPEPLSVSTDENHIPATSQNIEGNDGIKSLPSNNPDDDRALWPQYSDLSSSQPPFQQLENGRIDDEETAVDGFQEQMAHISLSTAQNSADKAPPIENSPRFSVHEVQEGVNGKAIDTSVTEDIDLIPNSVTQDAPDNLSNHDSSIQDDHVLPVFQDTASSRQPLDSDDDQNFLDADGLFEEKEENLPPVQQKPIMAIHVDIDKSEKSEIISPSSETASIPSTPSRKSKKRKGRKMTGTSNSSNTNHNGDGIR
ncbi:Late secretory pathway protein AVL9 [Neolecta irregularis DAH-3]|uniref:Late secretory pathway protein AVL9 n=1 Tax=Neolecta irregularis (strain DAH-3) TaxID=1198029 RepID=A0A1U7LG81_NEOID|nr:Late secretory pathway protein AVL9 [Neolecta irregularis DAH-3]|eukprot:OLL21666.1 Late secretory pathway protein AVL9 [Neolecta irregularis DAH-3]